MRFSNPMTASRFRRPISESTTATFFPCIARAVPRFAVVVVLPTPPFPDVIVITRLSIGMLSMLSNFFRLLLYSGSPCGGEGERSLGDTPKPPPGAQPLDPASQKPTCVSPLRYPLL